MIHEVTLNLHEAVSCCFRVNSWIEAVAPSIAIKVKSLAQVR